ncbi:MAG: DegV family protein [Anaerolineales bacterium]|nr:DegV family protein [Anaerolineales bacterium]
MSKVAIVTDSTAYLPPDVIQRYGIQTVPLQVIWDEEVLRDGIDIQPQDFYKRLATSASMPTTSQVTVADYGRVFRQLYAQGADILVITISNEMSGTLASATQAKAELPEAHIELVDSLSTTMHLGLIVLAAARAAEQGADLAACKAAAEQARQQSGVVFAVDTLEFLHRGGRIGGARRFLGTVLNIKPILTVTDGKVDALEQARTRRKSLVRLLEIIAERTDGKANLRLGVSHANAEAEAQVLLAQAQQQLKPVEAFLVELSPVIGTHVGPGTISLAYHYE